MFIQIVVVGFFINHFVHKRAAFKLSRKLTILMKLFLKKMLGKYVYHMLLYQTSVLFL